MRHFIDLAEVQLSSIDKLLRLSQKIRKNPSEYQEACRGKILATLFFEASTRTMLSFQAAMQRLGGGIIGFSNPNDSSVKKGETLSDTIRVVSNYSDLIALRHPRDGAAKAASIYSRSGIINAGDGGHQHPTQTLSDLSTLYHEAGRLDNLTVGICGDLKYGRTVHSLIQALTRFPGNRFELISSPQLQLPSYVKEQIILTGSSFSEHTNLDGVITNLDVLYMTRIQNERLCGEDNRSSNILTARMMESAQNNLVLLHPLPRLDEISPEVDADPRAKYFLQTEYGLYVRMALILTMLEQGELQAENSCRSSNLSRKCGNPQCITNSENYLPALLSKDGKCPYCSGELICDS